MRLSLMKAAHADVGGAPWQEIRVAHLFRPMYAQANMGARPLTSTVLQTSLLRGLGYYQILLEHSVGHLVGRHPQVAVGKGDGEDAEHHASAGFLGGLFEGERRAQRL